MPLLWSRRRNINLIQIKPHARAGFIVCLAACRTDKGRYSIVTGIQIIAGDRLAGRQRKNRRPARLDQQECKHPIRLAPTFITDIVDIIYADRQS